MQRPRLGLATEDLGLAPKAGLQSAARLGYRAVELAATHGDVDPANLSQSGARHLRRYVDGLGLELAALGGQLGASGFSDPATVDARIDRTRQILELAARLRVPVVTTSLGAVPGDADNRGRQRIVEALGALAEHADRTSTFLALGTGETAPADLRALLDEIGCPLVRVCYDPDGLLIHGHDALAGVRELGEHIIASHLRDATPGGPAAAGREVRMGTGQLDLLGYLAALEGGQYSGLQIVRRTDAVDPLADIAAARDYLEKLLR